MDTVLVSSDQTRRAAHGGTLTSQFPERSIGHVLADGAGGGGDGGGAAGQPDLQPSAVRPRETHPCWPAGGVMYRL